MVSCDTRKDIALFRPPVCVDKRSAAERESVKTSKSGRQAWEPQEGGTQWGEKEMNDDDIREYLYST